MRILNKSDLAEITLKSLVADYDYETMVNLYQPIVGYAATSLYFTFVAEGKNQRMYSLTNHEEILMKMQLTSGAFVDARKSLEAVGLIKTFYLEENGEVIYHYDIYSPRTPANFFDNALLYGMLIKCLGEANAEKIRNLYPLGQGRDYGEDISSKFTDVYHPKFDDKAFIKALNNEDGLIGRNAGLIQGNFSYEEFFKTLSEISQIKPESFNKKDMVELYRLTTLYGIDEKTAAGYVAENFNPTAPIGKKLDFKALTKLFQTEIDYSCTARKYVGKSENYVQGKSALASKINMMESVSPKKFLTLLQNGTQPASADMRLINDLSSKFNLNNSVINAVIDYTLSNCENVLSRAYAEKIAASLAREGVTTTIDAMNYLIKVNKSRSGKNSSKTNSSYEEIKQVKTQKSNDTKQETTNEDDDRSWDDILDDIDQGGSDGKA